MSQTQTTWVLGAVCVALGALACNAILGIDEATLGCPVGADCVPSDPDPNQPVAAAQTVETVLPGSDGGAPLPSAGAPSDGVGADAGNESTPLPSSPAPEPAEVPTPALPLAPVCSAGTVSCDGARLQICNAQGSGVMLLDDCGSAARCDAAATACSPAACEPGERRCQGAVLQVCNTDRTGFILEQQCASATLCSADGCAPALCAAEQRRCQGAQLELCNAERSGFEQEQLCASAALCTPVGCQPAACAANERRCQGTQLELCNADRTGFVEEQRCANANLCSPAGCQPPPPPPPTQLCVPGARRCPNTGSVAVCDASGLTETSSPCPFLQTCSEGACGLLGIPL